MFVCFVDKEQPVKATKRDIYLSEFESFTFKQRIYYVWANQIEIGGFNINCNPLKICLLDLLKIIYLPVLFIILIPLLVFPFSIYEAHELKSRFANNEDRTWFKSNQWIIEEQQK